jgi:membrane protein YqaA with SNARE-associated domain
MPRSLDGAPPTSGSRRLPDREKTNNAGQDRAATAAMVRRQAWLTLLFLALLLTAVGLSGLFMGDRVSDFANRVYGHLGFGGLAVVMLISETVVSPLPPDVILWIVASSDLAGSWYLPVAALALLSTLGGHLGWLLGRELGQTRMVRRIMGRNRRKTVELTRRYGIWAVVLAALTPVPWSVTSWTAGALQMPWTLYLLGSTVRVPRMILYYVFIHVAFHRW